MNIVGKLAFAQIRLHPGRMALTLLAMIAAACIVIWVVSGYDALASQFGSFAGDYLGRYNLIIMPETAPPGSPTTANAPKNAAQTPGSLQARDSDIPPSNSEAGQGPSSARGRGRGFGPGRGPGVRPLEIAPELIKELQNDPDIAEIAPALQVRVTVKNPNNPTTPDQAMGLSPTSPNASQRSLGAPGTANSAAATTGGGFAPGGGPRRGFGMMPSLVGTNAVAPPYKMAKGDWIDPIKKSDRLEAVLSKGLAEMNKADVGDEIIVRMGNTTDKATGEYRVKVIGIIEQPAQQPSLGAQPGGMPMMRGPTNAGVYVPMPLAVQWSGSPAIHFINVALKEGVKTADFQQRWKTRLAENKPEPAALYGFDDVKSGMEDGMTVSNVKKQAYAATGISLLASLFIIFTTLSMGVDERVRQLAVLRAVALTRAQVASLIVLEGLVLAFLGWIGGLAAGWGLLKIVSLAKPDVFPNGASLGIWCILLAGASALGGAILASILPAYHATRVRPMDAMTPQRHLTTAKWPSRMIGIGIVLILVNPLLVFVVPMSDDARYGIYAAVGCTCMAFGFLLITPLVISITEKIFGPLVAVIFGVERRLLQSQLTSNLWRTVGTTAALTLGLGLFVSMHIWGYSMLKPFFPGDWVPDVLACFPVGGLPEEEMENIRRIQGIDAQRCLPLAVEQPQLAEDITGSQQRTSVTKQDNVIMVGMDPDVGMGGDSPLMKLEFVQGTREEAAVKMKQGRWCVVPDHFARTTGLRIGDSFKMIPPEAPDKPVEYSIAGVVSLPGWHWMTKFSGLRRRNDRSAALIFASYDNIKSDFRLDKINFIWFDADAKTPLNNIGEKIKEIADRHPGEVQPVNGQGMWSVGATMIGNSVRLSTPVEIRSRIQLRADGMIWGMCTLPLVTLAVTALGVMNTVLASIRARRWEMGVMRAVGVTRSALTRLILCEAILIGLVACVLSFTFGYTAGWCGMGISQYVSFFGGLNPSVVIPWYPLSIGFGATLLLCLLAALYPAIATGRAEPLKLLQAGRATL